MYSHQKDAGFTLVEVLISLFIFALISAGTTGVMLQTFAAKDRLNVASAELADIAAFRAILRADMNAVTFRPMRDGVGGTENFLITTQDVSDPFSVLTFSRLGRSNPAGAPRGQVERVRYIFRDGQFIRQSLIHENPAQRDGWNGRVLLEGIEDVDVIYRNQVTLSGDLPTDLVLEDWSVSLIDDVSDIPSDGAIDFIITDARGLQTSHLFELGQ